MTSQDYIKVEHVRTRLLSSSLAKFQQFWSECFFKFCLVYFLLFTNALFNWRFQGPCVPLVFWKMENNILVHFFRLKSSNCFPVKTQVFGISFIFCTLRLQWLGFDLAPARVISDSISDLVVTSQDYIKFEHVRTWLLSSSLAKFNQFWTECFFSIFLQFFSSWLQGPSLIPVSRGRIIHGVVWVRLEMFFFRLKTSNCFPLKPMFSNCLHFLYFLFLIMGLWICTRTW